MKYKIKVTESERGWGMDFWEEFFDTKEAAQERINEINSQNTSYEAPDYYMQANETIYEIQTNRAALKEGE
jgi:hypothetical protein